jgi:hypothetical protein
MQDNTLIVALIAICSLVVTVMISFVVVWIRRRLNKTKSDPEVNMVNGNFEYRGIRYGQGLVRGGQYSPTYFQVTVPFPAGGKFRIKEETGFDRFFRKAGILRKIRTHDPDFDRRFYVST